VDTISHFLSEEKMGWSDAYDDPSNFANKAADELCDEYIGYLRNQRMEE